MNALFGERATAELVGKLRLLTACELCKKSCNETFFAVECSHYICKSCALQVDNACAKCSMPGMVLRAHYLDPISETVLKLKDLLCGGEHTPRSGANKRKADHDLLTPTTKAIKNSAATKIADMLKTPTIDGVFGRKSKPSTPATPRPLESQASSTPLAARSAQEVLLETVNLSKSIRDSPVIRTDIDGNHVCCSCSKQRPTEVRKSSDLGVQVSNSVLTLDVAVHARPAMADAQIQTDESMSGLSKPVLLSAGVQTEKPHVKVKRYFEIAIQTDDRLDETGKDLCAESKSLTSTQAGDANVTAHAQPISLDMSPIKQIERSNASHKTTSKPENNEDTIDFSGDEVNRGAASKTDVDFTSCSRTPRDTLDSLDYKTMDLKGAEDKRLEKENSTLKLPSPEPDSLDSVPSDFFNNGEEERKSSAPKKNDTQPEQRDTLESFFKSSEEASIPETEPPSKFASPVKMSKSKRAVARPDPDSPLRLAEKKKKAVIVSDEDEPASNARSEVTDQRSRSSKAKAAAKVRDNKTMKKSQSQLAKAVPNFSSDEDDPDPLPIPMDTEDMRNLEQEMENLDREMEDSKTFGRSRY